jgi:hypothetical protein
MGYKKGGRICSGFATLRVFRVADDGERSAWDFGLGFEDLGMVG